MNDRPDTLEQLSARMDALEQRVHELEQASHATARPLQAPATAAEWAPAPDLPSGEQISSAFLLLGKSLLGIAGAYLLRALAEWNVLPRLLIAAVAIAYAIAWLVAASRTPSRARLAPILFACTSALILAPMLGELTMRFHVLSPVASAAVLGLFVAAATVLARRDGHASAFMVAYGAAALTALVLSIVTQEMLAFLALLLAMLAICEQRSFRVPAQGVRIMVAAMADCAAWILIVIYRTPASTRADYPARGVAALAWPAALLFLITVAGVVFRTIALRRRITAFETAQSVVAFLLWILSWFYLVPGFSPRIVGIVCILFAATCYAGAYGVFRPRPQPRNFHVFAVWSAVLLLAGAFLILPTVWAAACLALTAVAGAVLARRIGCHTLECHGVVYLSAAALGCGLLSYAFGALAGAIPASIAWSILLLAGCALLTYAAAQEHDSERWELQLLHLLSALLAVSAIAALTAHATLSLLARGITPAAFHIAFIRTLILCVIALALAFAGSRWRRLELKRLAYAGLALIAAKLVYEDLRHGHMGFIAASLCLFALALIGVPRLARADTPPSLSS